MNMPVIPKTKYTGTPVSLSFLMRESVLLLLSVKVRIKGTRMTLIFHCMLHLIVEEASHHTSCRPENTYTLFSPTWLLPYWCAIDARHRLWSGLMYNRRLTVWSGHLPCLIVILITIPTRISSYILYKYVVGLFGVFFLPYNLVHIFTVLKT